MTAPAVSVLMPVYNGERWLSQAIESALAQTFIDFELVVVDDGSTDGSAAIVEAFARRDPRVRLVRTAHGGIPVARSITLAEARGRFVAFLDQDDEWLPPKLERQLPHVDEGTVVFSDFRYLADGSPSLGLRHSETILLPALQYPATGLFPHLLAYGCFVPLPTVLAPRELLIDAGAFRYADLHGFRSTWACDFEMWLLLALRGVRFDYVDEPLVVYRRHAGATSADAAALFEATLPVFDSVMPEVSGSDRRLLRRARREWRKSAEVSHRKKGWARIVAGDTGAARRELVHSFRYRPYSLRAWLALVLALCPPVARQLVRGRV